MDILKDRVAVVTGAASGLGRAMVEKFGREGMRVVLADVDEPSMGQVADTLTRDGVEHLCVRTDVSDAAAVATLADRAYERFGAVHVLCNNAGVAAGGTLWERSLDDWEWVLGVNLWGVIHGIRSFVPKMIASGEPGHVVNTASIAGLLCPAFLGPYVPAKHAVVGLSETMFHELAIKKARIGVSVLCPGFVRTQIAKSERNRPKHLRSDDEPSPELAQVAAAVQAQVDAGVEPSVVADAVADAIRARRLYILTHPDQAQAVQNRFDAIMAGENPHTVPFR